MANDSKALDRALGVLDALDIPEDMRLTAVTTGTGVAA